MFAASALAFGLGAQILGISAECEGKNQVILFILGCMKKILFYDGKLKPQEKT